MNRKPPRRSSLRRPILAVAALLMLVGCGSTVQWTDTIAEGGTPGIGTEDELTLEAPQASQETGDGGASAPQEGQPGTATDVAASQDAASAAVSPSRSKAPVIGAPAPGTSGPGFTAKEIYIGFSYNSQSEQGAARAGFNVAVGDPKKIASTVAEDINEKGGIAGRRIVLVFYDVRRGPADPNAAAQATCVRWTDERRVFAGIFGFGAVHNETLYNCLTREKVIFFGGSNTRVEQARYAPYSYAPNSAVAERFLAVWVRRLVALGYFKDGWDIEPAQPGREPTKIGLLYGKEKGDVFPRILENELARHGLSATATFQWKDNGPNEMSQVVLKFRQAGVTHVIGDGGLIGFTPAAAAQNYNPRYGISTLSGPGLLKVVAPARQLEGALGVGMWPILDVDNAEDPGETSPAQGHCRKIMEEDGHPTTSRLAFAAMVVLCDQFQFLDLAVESGGVSPSGVQHGLRLMGSMPPASTFKITFPDGRPDGASAVRDLAYRETCKCFFYMNPTNRDM